MLRDRDTRFQPYRIVNKEAAVLSAEGTRFFEKGFDRTAAARKAKLDRDREHEQENRRTRRLREEREHDAHNLR